MRVEWTQCRSEDGEPRQQWSTRVGPFHLVVTGSLRDGGANAYLSGTPGFHLDGIDVGRYPTAGSAQRACVEKVRDIARELAADLDAQLAAQLADDDRAYLAAAPGSCRGIEIEPGVFSGCDPSRAPAGGNDCPTCGPVAVAVSL